MLKTLLFAIRLLWREIRSGQWFIIFFALLLAITALTGLQFYTDRLMRGLDNQSAILLGGDIVISSPIAIPKTWEDQAQRLRLRTANVWLYPSVVSTADKLQLVNLQAVSNNYPLLGNESLSIAPNTALVEPRLLPLLAVRMNDTITIGAASFRVRERNLSDVEMGNVGWVIAPKVIIRLDDVPKTQTVLPGSRIDYRLLVAGEPRQILNFQRWLAPQLKPGQRILNVKQQSFVLRETLQRAQDFIQLVILVCLLMSGVAIAMSVRQYLNRHYSHVALWRCLGAQEKQVAQIMILQLLVLALLAGLFGVTLGYMLQAVFANVFKQYFQFPLPQTGFAPIGLGFITSTLLLFSYAYPIINELPRTSPLYLWRNETTNKPLQRPLYMIIAVIFLLAYIYWAMDFSLLALFFLDALLLSIGFLYAFSILVLSVLRKLMMITQGTMRRGIAELVYHPESTSVQLTAFTLIVMALIILATLRHDLIKHWQTTLPNNAPNYFTFNIAPADVTHLQTFLRQHGIATEGIYPMVRGRLIALNDKPIMTAVPESARGHNALHRELNLSAMLHYPSDNKIISGVAWQARDVGKPIISVANNLSDDLQFKLGDRLSFQIGDKTVSAVINNIRSLEWGSFHPNFYVIFPPGMIDRFPTTYVTSFYLQPYQKIILNQLVQQFPNITVIDIADVLNQVQRILDKIILAIQYLFFFALGAGILIFITSLQASQDERRATYHLLRVLGASKKYIYKSIAVEFGFLGLLIIILSYSLASVISYLLIKTIFSL